MSRLVACLTAIVAAFAIQATAASAVVTVVHPGSTHTSFGPSGFAMDVMAGYAGYSNVSCTISGGSYQTLSAIGVDDFAWFSDRESPNVSCPGTGVTWLTSGSWDVAVQGSLDGNHEAIIEITQGELTVGVGSCGVLNLNQLVTLTGRWIDGSGTTDARIRFDQDTLIPAVYSGSCAGLGTPGARSMVVRAGSEWAVRNNNNFGPHYVGLY